MLDQSRAALARRGLHLPAPMAAAASWLSDSKLMRHVSNTHRGPVLVRGKSTESSHKPSPMVSDRVERKSQGNPFARCVGEVQELQRSLFIASRVLREGQGSNMLY